MATATKTIFITGGIVSGLGKGITAASLGTLLKARGFSVEPLKMDPYLNVDAGTMNPFQHGEVFVTDDGAETDLDLGHYERFLDMSASKLSNFTTGAIYQSVTEEERKGTYLGKTIQVIPHVTDEIQRRISLLAHKKKPDFEIVEVGGTVGDIEALPYLEAVRQFSSRQPRECLFVHVVKLDYLYPSNEIKTKPIQQSVALLRSFGITPNILIVRAKEAIQPEVKQKIAQFCGVHESQIISAIDARSLYDIPLSMEREGLSRTVLRLFDVDALEPDLARLETIAERTRITQPILRIGLVGKYTNLSDAYISVIEAAKHGAIANKVKVEIVPVDSEHLSIALLRTVDGIIVPGGFGSRGVEGKIRAIRWAREHGIPFLGICLGLQCAVIEIARDMANLENANSEEFDESTPHPVIAFLPDQVGVERKGGTMRLGTFDARLETSLISKLYRWGKSDALDFPSFQELNDLKPLKSVQERHRHRYEVNPNYHKALRDAGLVIAGTSPDGSLVEFVELPLATHPYFVATQAHPEFKSRPTKAHPLFAGLIRAALELRLRQLRDLAGFQAELFGSFHTVIE